jgi:hypothetical protein
MQSFASFVVFSLALACSSQLRADLIINGSFETPDVPNGGFNVFAPGSSGITGWTVIGSGSSDVAIVDQDAFINPLTFNAQSGRQWLDLAGNTTNNQTSGVTQNVATTAGTEYLLSFWVGSATNATFSIFPSTVRLQIDSEAPISLSNTSSPTTMLDWQQFTHQFTATGSTTAITFLNGSAPRTDDENGNELSGLDNVSLRAVPEPSSISMVAICGSAFMLNRKRGRTMRYTRSR